ncbi:upf0481 protein at3g47200 [Phtheirospermum japonicum]|uniref:Upf0481 protein at3g47200 n=1 Tax=Phtheirospermum japonicum TaxID=374723 RepID=A0A830BQW6_9LAMI|nr:upf0481 protein at3g47200 [Phtheirospermum japonicum]
MAQPPLPSDRKIPRVPQLLRQEERNRGAYDPKAVSFGPYHHGKQELQLCQQVKPFVLRSFLMGSSQTKEFFFFKILPVVSAARDCYIEGSTDAYTDEAFAEMMLLDGCFLIYYVLACIGSVLVDQGCHFLVYKHLGRLLYSLINRDIFLMENQIPLFIVRLLIDSRYGDAAGWEEALREFMHKTIWGVYKQQHVHRVQQKELQPPPLDLFEAFRQVLFWDWTPEAQTLNHEDLKQHYNTFRSVKDLKSKGIHFGPSSYKSLEAIDFRSFTLYGRLQLPTWFVSSLSKVFFLNMIAYEICPNTLVDTKVISYVGFMKSLLDGPADVKELREKRILLTDLGGDDEVVQLYRDLDTYGMGSVWHFQEVKQRIQIHYDSKTKTWMAELIHDYLRSPWTFIAWLAALFILILTFMQTYFTINPRN